MTQGSRKKDGIISCIKQKSGDTNDGTCYDSQTFKDALRNSARHTEEQNSFGKSFAGKMKFRDEPFSPHHVHALLRDGRPAYQRYKYFFYFFFNCSMFQI